MTTQATYNDAVLDAAAPADLSRQILDGIEALAKEYPSRTLTIPTALVLELIRGAHQRQQFRAFLDEATTAWLRALRALRALRDFHHGHAPDDLEIQLLRISSMRDAAGLPSLGQQHRCSAPCAGATP